MKLDPQYCPTGDKRHIVGDIRLSSGLLGFPVKVVAFDPNSVLRV